MNAFKRVTVLLLASVLVLTQSCSKIFDKEEAETDFGKVAIFYLAGHNSLYSHMIANLGELKEGYLPKKDSDEAIVVISHGSYNYSVESGATYPYIMRLYEDSSGVAVLDTLHYMWNDELLTDSEVMKSALDYVYKRFSSRSYSFLFSSHASGWLPVGYYENPDKFSSKSIGIEVGWENGEKKSVELTPQEFAASFPCHMDCVLIDACLAGGVEIAYELKDVTDYIVFSQAEVLSDGFPYEKLAEDIFCSSSTLEAVTAVCEDYYERYNSQWGDDKSATISAIKTEALPSLAAVCAELFEKYSAQIASLDYNKVQRYYRYSIRHWFFDLEDIFLKAGVEESDASYLSSALDSAVVAKKATTSFMLYSGGFPINHFSGLSSYLPCSGNAYLNAAYKELAWNKATSLVK